MTNPYVIVATAMAILSLLGAAIAPLEAGIVGWFLGATGWWLVAVALMVLEKNKQRHG